MSTGKIPACLLGHSGGNNNKEPSVQKETNLPSFGPSININSALQTSRTYIRETDKDSSYVNNSSLSSTLNLNRYAILKEDDHLRFNVSTYQVVNKYQEISVTPTVLPYITYDYQNLYRNTHYNNNLQFYLVL